MENYTYHSEIRRMILHFMSAIDGAVVKRYDKNQNPVDSIKVNYVYGPKERIMKDLINKSEHIKLPIVAVNIKSITRDNERVKDKIVGRYEELGYLGTMKNIPAPVPVNITFNVSMMAKYQQDMEQLLTNFIPYTDPYFIVSWKEPFTNYEIRSEVRWNGDISLDYPEELKGNDPYQQLTANTSFDFKGYIFKDKATTVGKICKIETDYILTDKFYCDYDMQVAYTSATTTETFTISGMPKVQWCDPTAIKTGSTMSGCSGNFEPYFDPNEYHGRTEQLTIEGWFPKVTDIFLSASDPNMFINDSVSAFDIFEGDTSFPEFSGILVRTYDHPIDTPHNITFDIPILSGNGYLDIIVVNSCGYSKLSQDRRTLESCCENPYNVSHTLYEVWNSLQDPFLSGVEVIQTSLECVSGLNLLGTIGGKVIKSLGDYYMIEL